MPKMFSKQSAVHALLTLGERLAWEAAEKNLPEMVSARESSAVSSTPVTGGVSQP
jgi:hypothetical protein